MPRAIAPFALAFAFIPTISAQTPRAEFDVVSIKRSAPDAVGGSMRTLPDGTQIMANVRINQFITSAAPVPVREVVGLPEWAQTERYDVTAKPPADSTREQRRQMWQTLFSERMKLEAHVEQREKDTFALVIARSDGRLGPQLKPSTLDCSPRPPGSPAPPPPPPPTDGDVLNRCGGRFGNGSIMSGGITMDSLVGSLGGLAGRLVNNRTGLRGFYSLTLTFAPPRTPEASDAPLPDDAPEFFTALQEQLGLKLQPEKSMVPVFVIDRIERPTEN
jgi:bla regulator protein blaR1